MVSGYQVIIVLEYINNEQNVPLNMTNLTTLTVLITLARITVIFFQQIDWLGKSLRNLSTAILTVLNINCIVYQYNIGL